MKKCFLLILALFAGFLSVFAQQDYKEYIADLSELQKLNVERRELVFTNINAAGEVMFNGSVIEPSALRVQLQNHLLSNYVKQGKKYYLVIMKDKAVSTTSPVFETVAKQQVAAVQALRQQQAQSRYGKSFSALNDDQKQGIIQSLPLRMYVGAPLPPPPAPTVEVLEIREDEPEREEISIQEEEDAGDETIYIVAETMPEFPGGNQAMFNFLKEKMKYPVVALEKKKEGRSICQFIVEKDGTITDVQVVRSAGVASMDREAVRLIKAMPNWKPGMQRGKLVRVKYTVPVNFKLPNLNKIDDEFISMEYNADRWSQIELETPIPGVYAFSYKPFPENVLIEIKQTEADPEQTIQDMLQNDSFFSDLTTHATRETTFWDNKAQLMVYHKPADQQLHEGLVIVGNSNGKQVIVQTFTSNIKETEYLQLVWLIKVK